MGLRLCALDTLGLHLLEIAHEPPPSFRNSTPPAAVMSVRRTLIPVLIGCVESELVGACCRMPITPLPQFYVSLREVHKQREGFIF